MLRARTFVWGGAVQRGLRLVVGRRDREGQDRRVVGVHLPSRRVLLPGGGGREDLAAHAASLGSVVRRLARTQPASIFPPRVRRAL